MKVETGSALKQFHPETDPAKIAKIKWWKVEILSGILLNVNDGPPVPVEVGRHCLIHDKDLVRQLFAGNAIKPIDPAIPEIGQYEVRRGWTEFFEGAKKEVHQGDIVELSQEEAILHLKNRQVVPIDDKNFF